MFNICKGDKQLEVIRIMPSFQDGTNATRPGLPNGEIADGEISEDQESCFTEEGMEEDMMYDDESYVDDEDDNDALADVETDYDEDRFGEKQPPKQPIMGGKPMQQQQPNKDLSPKGTAPGGGDRNNASKR